MNRDLKSLLTKVQSNEVSIDEALGALESYSFVDMDEAKVDIGRKSRQGNTEVIYGEGKTADQILAIVNALQKSGQASILITRLDADKASELKDSISLDYYETPRIGIIGSNDPVDVGRYILICTGGTSDIPVAEEAALTAEFMGNEVHRVFDVGVAGIHRLLRHADEIEDAACIIVVAGMEGALASVVGGIARCPIIAVPTSVGYGSSFGGLSALLSMLNSCASGITVVNIDNGFGAALAAHRINHPVHDLVGRVQSSDDEELGDARMPS